MSKLVKPESKTCKRGDGGLKGHLGLLRGSIAGSDVFDEVG